MTRRVTITTMAMTPPARPASTDDHPTGPAAAAAATTTTTTTVSDPCGAQTALLTPLPTMLKSDLLGIGLKANTEGQYRTSVKRVTPNAAALAAHVRPAEDMRRGKGRSAFARAKAHREGKEAEHDGLPERTLNPVFGTWHLPRVIIIILFNCSARVSSLGPRSVDLRICWCN